MTTSQPEREEQIGYRDVYSHPAAVAYAAAHPRRQIPKFGPYLLLQTLGEGEFGKVKLGLHSQWGEEVAVKLIRRGNIDSPTRMSKVEREIEVLRTIKHPNIVRLYDVIETDKYIGIILEYASGGELFDHILAHRYLKEKDACKLFAQLISGVWYIHQKKIVHRDLKLENLLLDRHRNVIITDFGFANRFEHKADDLMQTSCGSPCYAAPELVISEGLYVGSAVDIWSCGVILYAMLAGYLPFDDDPANPDGDNINLLYRYIVNTQLTFPDYVSQEARDLLSLMLVPDPTHRADLKKIMAHRWLRPYAHLFERSVQDLERLAMEQHQMKRLAYQRQMKQQAAAAAAEQQKIQRSQSARIEMQPPSQANGSRRQQQPANEEYLYEANPDESLFSSPALPPVKRHPVSAVVGPSKVSGYEDDPFGPPPTVLSKEVEEARTRKGSTPTRSSSKKQAPPPVAVAPVKTSPERRKADRQRHTIQLEYGGEEDRPAPPSRSHGKSRERMQPREIEEQVTELDGEDDGQQLVTIGEAISPDESQLSPATQRHREAIKGASISKATKPLPTPPLSNENGFAPPESPSIEQTDSQQESVTPSDADSTRAPMVSITPTSPPRNASFSAMSAMQDKEGQANGSAPSSVNSGISAKGRHKKGMSVDKIVNKFWGTSSDAETSAVTNGSKARHPSDTSVTPTGTMRTPVAGKGPSTLDVSAPSPDSKQSVNSNVSPAKKEKDETKKSRRNTLTIMVEPISKRISQRASKNRNATTDHHPPASAKEKPTPLAIPKKSAKNEEENPETPRFPRMDPTDETTFIPASTNKASRVMQWFRQRSKSRAASPTGEPVDNAATPVAENQYALPHTTDNQAPAVVVQPGTPGPLSQTYQKGVKQPSIGRSASANVPETHSLIPRTMNRLSSMVTSPQPPLPGYNKTAIRLHHGAVDQQTTVTTPSPPDVMAQVTRILLDMGLELQRESEYKYRCIRPKKKKAASSAGMTAFTMVGSAASNGVDKRGLPVPSQSSFSSTGGMLKGLLMRRQSSQVSAQNSIDGENGGDSHGVSSSASGEKLAVMPSPPSHEPMYGDRTVDQGDEIRFSVELTRIDGLDDTYSIDIRRLKGQLRSYKFLYDVLRERIDFSQ